MQQLDQNFWNTRWIHGQTGWDIGYASPVIVDYFQKIEDKNAAILIPGCGNAYEAEALKQFGFTNITLLDISNEAVKRLNEKFEPDSGIQVICTDFFLHQGSYDFIVEQTFFCALHPKLREKYVQKMYDLLKPEGKLVGLLFNTFFEKGWSAVWRFRRRI